MMKNIILVSISLSFLLSQDVTLSFGNINYEENSVEVWLDSEINLRVLTFYIDGVNLIDAIPVLGIEYGFFYNFTPETGYVYTWDVLDFYMIPPIEDILFILFFDDVSDVESCIYDFAYEDEVHVYHQMQGDMDCTIIDVDPQVIPGDANNDGILDVTDIVSMVSIILLTSELSLWNLCFLDINEDWIVDIIDVVMLVNLILSNG
ncbi:MAG: hypothetical protein HN729_05445 [Candidatus Marinimicrobia bacterium]|jgi:hypothetical protein|nr:hypothetical protein [Candidatus Neomarinimicrobiota bacterium]MBT3634381.1 hypothetical protein [Candidatus Neomarinimicrobiota bacterium]MBT3681710.1 hypothetical protein [Candidatus Neomarinimicrobiota bacterium]MBT3759436.1 hypothetical protein [Candidatus Neomarinimicrobiota bacterium]MBT3895924.1 hypothetical protein [Candidatus Neomarinimicrobiota bacterium]